MNDHDCPNGTRVALLEQTVTIEIPKQLDAITKQGADTLKLLQGEGDKPGVMTRLTLNDYRINRVYIFLTGLALAVIGAVVNTFIR